MWPYYEVEISSALLGAEIGKTTLTLTLLMRLIQRESYSDNRNARREKGEGSDINFVQGRAPPLHETTGVSFCIPYHGQWRE